MIHEFFVVTINSVYHATDTLDTDGRPTVIKIDGRDQTKRVNGTRLTGGELVGILRSGLMLYQEELSHHGRRKQRPELVMNAYWGDRTSAIVALFLTRQAAQTCWRTVAPAAIDQRLALEWQMQTRVVLNNIGDEHPAFVIAKDPDDVLVDGWIPPSGWKD